MKQRQNQHLLPSPPRSGKPEAMDHRLQSPSIPSPRGPSSRTIFFRDPSPPPRRRRLKKKHTPLVRDYPQTARSATPELQWRGPTPPRTPSPDWTRNALEETEEWTTPRIRMSALPRVRDNPIMSRTGTASYSHVYSDASFGLPIPSRDPPLEARPCTGVTPEVLHYGMTERDIRRLLEAYDSEADRKGLYRLSTPARACVFPVGTFPFVCHVRLVWRSF